MAYVPQEAWLRNDTLENNIYFGNPVQRNRYEQILDKCALRQDIEMLPAGGQTEIGEMVSTGGWINVSRFLNIQSGWNALYKMLEY